MSAALWAQSTEELLQTSPRPTAIIAANDSVATVVMRTVRQAGLRIPDDISVVGIDNQPFSALLDPALTTIQLPLVEAGKRAIELLLGEHHQADHVALPCPLIVRESTGSVTGELAADSV